MHRAGHDLVTNTRKHVGKRRIIHSELKGIFREKCPFKIRFKWSKPRNQFGKVFYACDPDGKESACNAAELVSIPGLERSPGEGNGYPLQ